MALSFIDEITPNGNSFAIVDINNVKGGVHNAKTKELMNKIHKSRLAPGVLCYCEEDSAYYTYDFEINEWILADLGGKDAKFQCALTAIKDEDSTITGFGNLPSMRKEDLEKLTVNEILTRALFKELPPFYKQKVPTLTAKSLKEVGSVLLTTDWTFNNGTYEYGYIDGSETSGTIIEKSGNRVLNVDKVNKCGTINNAITGQYIYNPIPTTNLSLMTSWDRTLEAYNADNTPISKPSLPTFQTTNINGSIVGYYVLQYVAVSDEIEGMTLAEHFSQYAYKIKNKDKSTVLTLKNITSTGYVDIGTHGVPGKEANSPFVYVLIPSKANITNARILNGLTGNYDNLDSTQFGKVSSNISNTEIPNILSFTTIKRIVSNKELYEYAVWFIAKGSPNAQGKVSPSKNPIEIQITV